MQTEHFDVLIVGAGLSGIGAAHHLQTTCPNKTYAILEARSEIGGTWDLFRYPGVRSDSDMFTLGYGFRPWKEPKAIADGPSILKYIKDTAHELGIQPHIRFQTKVVSAAWSSAASRWSVVVETGTDKQRAEYTCSFLYTCSGYYNYENGYTPEFPERESFRGQIIHPQHWPENLDYRDKRVVVIGSGATAVTLVPAMAKDAAHVTMLQRSPTYIVTVPAQDVIADFLRAHVPSSLAHRLVRTKNVGLAMFLFQLSRRAPKLAKRLIRAGVAQNLPADFDIDAHFKPRYEPWDQRLCLIPDADFFHAVKKGKASIVTDRIAAFTPKGIKLESGAELETDIIVTATGLDLLAIGGIDLRVDGDPVDISKSYTYKGVMLSNVPNFAFCVGYTNASWTLRADLSSDFVCRVLKYMDSRGFSAFVPKLDGSMDAVPILDLKSGYVERAAHRFPKQGTRAPWYLPQNYVFDRITMKLGRIDDGVLRFSTRATVGGGT
ncbi:MAG: NAD(P)/FAD-dependent oxidoreductase [Polyangiaceae bacterium]